MSDDACPHRWSIEEFDDNENRTRTVEVCLYCKAERSGCCAKRLADRSMFVEGYEGDLEAWGPVGVWHYSK